MDVNTDMMIIEITGLTTGVFWGVQTLLSITQEGRVPNIVIHDEPRFSYQGMSLDVARNFFAKEEIFKLLEMMAMYKLNNLHMHGTKVRLNKSFQKSFFSAFRPKHAAFSYICDDRYSWQISEPYGSNLGCLVFFRGRSALSIASNLSPASSGFYTYLES